MDSSDSKLATVSGPIRFSVPPLLSPGTESNYLDWSFVVEVNLEAAGLSYVLKPIAADKRPPTWPDDNKTVVSVLTQIVHP